MEGKPATNMEEDDLGPFADADPAWLRAQILPALEEYDRDPSTGVPMERVFEELKAMLRARMR